MSAEQAGTAPAGAPPATETVTAERVASERSDFGAFQQASRDRRAGKPAANVERPKSDQNQDAGAAGRRTSGQPAAVAGRDGAPAKGPKPADAEADERLTARIREAVDTSTAELRKKNTELEEQVAGLRRGSASTDRPAADGGRTEEPAKRTALTSADMKRYQALPGAPHLDDKDAQGEFLYETSQDYAIAMADFVRDARASERAEAGKGQADRVERVRREATRVTSFASRIETFKKANPDQLAANDKGEKVRLPLSTEVGGLHGFAKLHELNEGRKARGLESLPATVDHAIAEELYDSEIPAHVAVFLSTHPEELGQLRQCGSPAQLTRAFGRLEERVIKADPQAAAVLAGGAAAVQTVEASTGETVAKPDKQTVAESRRKAEDAADRSVSSAKPLEENLGRPGAGGVADPEAQAISKNDFGMFQEIQRTRRLEQLQARRGTR